MGWSLGSWASVTGFLHDRRTDNSEVTCVMDYSVTGIIVSVFEVTRLVEGGIHVVLGHGVSVSVVPPGWSPAM